MDTNSEGLPLTEEWDDVYKEKFHLTHFKIQQGDRSFQGKIEADNDNRVTSKSDIKVQWK